NHVYRTTNGGGTWLLNFDFATDSSNGLTGPFGALACPDTSTCYAAGTAGEIGMTVNGGQTWVTDLSPVLTDLTGVSCSSPSTCDFSTSGSTVVRTTDYGATFNVEYGSGSLDFKAVSCPGAAACSAAGSACAIAATTNAGAAWSLQAPIGPTTEIRRMACPDA